MDPVRNPFAPGAGAQPPELVGREEIIDAAHVGIRRVLQGRPSQSWMMLGLRGTGKTVLLNHIARLAESEGALTVKIEAPETGDLPKLLVPRLLRVLRKLSASENAKAFVHRAMRGLRSFAGAFKVEIGTVGISVDPEPGLADSGELDMDMADIFETLGRAAQADGRAVAILIDEVQYLSGAELAAVITAIHHTNQEGLPVIFFGAGLPQVAALSGEAKSYAERLFRFADIGPLGADAAAEAIREPLRDEGVDITERALGEIVATTEGYPYFLQEWGYQVWNAAEAVPIDVDVIALAEDRALARLDEGFFKVRMDRLTPKERDYVYAMASLPGYGPYRSGDIADAMGEATNRLGPVRHRIIAKGMIYSPAHGDVAFTVPGFKDYLHRLRRTALER